ncbi:MAG: asparagine synthase C-terminal domain-containing protein [Euryarchaeota archaeon]|nr:asparagine synthase C-terminal domain-containing protein [Euryarchaeota archaeon]
MQTNETEAIRELTACIKDAVRLCMKDRDHIGVAFSGGIDSSLVAAIAASIDPDIELYAVGMHGSHDVNHAEKAAALLGMGDRLRICECTEADIESAIPRVLHAMKTTSPVAAGIGICMYLVSKCAHECGTGLLLTGQGADELFAGYKRYEQAFDDGVLCIELEKDVLTLPGQIGRDVLVAELCGMELCLPICNHDVVDVACGIDARLKLRKEGGEYIRKYILRRVSEQHLPHRLAWAPKKAAQYGTGVQNALYKMAHRQGLRQEDFLSRVFDDI